MKRILISVAVMALALFAAKLYAGEPSALKMVKPDWHYRWHEGRWWYWMPESSKWMVWSGSAWIPQDKVATCNCMQPVSQTKITESSGEASANTGTESGGYEPAYSGGGDYGAGYSSGSGDASYGWSWGPGTAFRDSPGRRF